MAILSTFGAMTARGFGWLLQAAGGGIGGSLYAWGFNSNGQLGQGNTTSYSSPVQIGSLTTWKFVNYGCAIKTDDTLWMWGVNSFGQLGQGNITSYSSPVQVGTLTWSTISVNNGSSIAIQSNGTLWGWGFNGSGTLGVSNTTNYSSPVQVGALTNWSKIAVANDSSGGGHVLAIKTDGTLWAWGSGGNGQIGDSTTTTYSSPVQIGALTTWAEISAGGLFSLAVKTDGTLWAWGSNGQGQLGVSSTTSYSSPIQVGSSTNWLSTKISGGAYSSFGIRS